MGAPRDLPDRPAARRRTSPAPIARPRRRRSAFPPATDGSRGIQPLPVAAPAGSIAAAGSRRHFPSRPTSVASRVSLASWRADGQSTGQPTPAARGDRRYHLGMLSHSSEDTMLDATLRFRRVTAAVLVTLAPLAGCAPTPVAV